MLANTQVMTSNFKKDLPKYVAIPVESLKDPNEHANLRVIENLFIKQLADGSICLVHANEDIQVGEEIAEKPAALPVKNARVKSRSVLMKHSLRKQFQNETMLPDKSEDTANSTEQKYRCIKCEDIFDSLLQFRDHMKWHKCQKKFKCPHCFYGFNAENNLTIHLVLDHSGKIYSRCPICNLNLGSQRTASLKSHLMLHQVEEIYTCDECDGEFDREDDYIKHMESHAAIKKRDLRPLTCSYCKVEFKDSKEHRAHVSDHVKLKKKFLKPKRPRKSGANREQNNHVCGVCNKSFIKNSLLERHNRIHSGERPFKCEICNRGFTQKGTLQIHLSRHAGHKPFSCTLCPARFNQKGNLRVHIQKTHTFPNGGQKMYKCSQCTCIFKKIATLNGHVTKVHLTSTHSDNNTIDDVMWKLKELAKQTSNTCKDRVADENIKSELREHVVVTGNVKECTPVDKGNTVQLSESTTDGALRKYVVKQRRIGDVRWYFCNYCTKKFKKPSDLIRHIRVHTKEKPFKCKQCNARFSLKSTLGTHIKTHENRLEFKCKICDTSFASLRMLNAHLRKHEFDSLPKWQCVTCGYLFDEYEKAFQHREDEGRDKPHIIQPFIQYILKQPILQTAYGLESPTIRPFHCNICDARFTKRINLKRHIQFHNGERNFKCNICTKSFITSYRLTEHMNYHNDVRKYPCKLCDKRYVTASLLKRHVIIHNAHKPYQCPYCLKTFKTILLCRTHIRQVHKKEVVPKIEVEVADSLTNSSIGNNLKVENFIEDQSEVVSALSVDKNGVTQDLSNTSQSLIIQEFLPSNGIQILTPQNEDVQDPTNYQTIYVNIDELQFLENSGLDLSNATLQPLNTNSLLINQMDNIQDNVIFNIDSLNPDLNLPPVEILPAPPEATAQRATNTTLPSIAEISTKTIKLSSYSEKTLPGKSPNSSTLLADSPGLFQNISYAQELTLPTTMVEDCNVFDQNFQPAASVDLSHAGIFESTNVMCLTCSRVFVTIESFQNHSCALLAQESRYLEVKSEDVNSNSDSTEDPSVPHQCHLCKKTLANKFSFQRHLNSHAVRPNFECDICKKVINGRNMYIKHLATHKSSSGKLLRTCKYCLKNFKKPSDLNRHLRTHTGEKPYACNLCDKNFSLKSTLDSHIKTHDPTPKEFTCNVCNSPFSSKGSLKVHLTIHTGQRPHKCSFCEQRFRTPGNRRSHEILMHLPNSKKKQRNRTKVKITSVLESMASELDGGQTDKGEENTGNKRSTNQIEPQVVNLIPPSENLLSNLNEEDQIAIDPVILLQQLQMSGVILTNDAEPVSNLLLDDIPLLSIDNTKDNAQEGSLLSKEINGSGGTRKTGKPRNIECDTCHKMYTSKDVLRKHKKKVHGKNTKFPCIKCDKGFDTQDGLNNHVKLHAGYRPFSCLYCANSFTEEQSLKTHVKRIHQHSNAMKETTSALLNIKFDLQSENVDDPLFNNIFMLKKID